MRTTPGPWGVQAMGHTLRIVHGAADPETGFRDDVPGFRGELTLAGRANLELAAAAPALLDALRHAVEWEAGEDLPEPPWVEEARAAIAAAQVAR